MIKTLAIEIGLSSQENENSLINSAIKLGLKVLKVRRVPFSNDWLDLDYNPIDLSLLKDSSTWFYGDITSCKIAQQTTNWIVDADWSNLSLDCISNFDFILNNDFCFLTINDLINNAEKYIQDVHFVKPVGVDKLFSGQVISKNNFQKDLSLLMAYDPPFDSRIAICSPKNIKKEIRFFIVKNKIVCGSVYNFNGSHKEFPASDEEYKNAEIILNKMFDNGFFVNSNWTLDVCQISNDEYRLLEVGAASCSGLYKINTEELINALIGENNE